MSICGTVSGSAGFISTVISQIDCQAQTLGFGGWSALAAPGSTLNRVLIGFTTIYVALIGYTLLFGQTATVRSGTLAAVKVGAVFALATSWSAYSILAYNVVTDGPSQIVAEIGPRAGVAGFDGTLAQRLDHTDNMLAQLAVLSASNVPASSDAQTPPPPFGGFDAFAIGGSRVLFELTAVVSVGVVRLICGLLLALGPFFIAFLMFDGTTSLFVGWVRVLAGAALASIGGSIGLGLEVGLLDPWIRAVMASLASGRALPSAPTQLFVLTSFFTISTLAMLWASARIAAAFNLPFITRWTEIWRPSKRTAARVQTVHEDRARLLPARPSRAAAVASAIRVAAGRDSRVLIADGQLAAGSNRSAFVGPGQFAGQLMGSTGRTFTRSAKSRLSARATQRDAAR